MDETRGEKIRIKDRKNGSVQSAVFGLWRVHAWTIMNLLSIPKEKYYGKDF
jgi:hypothetical protein